MKRKPLSKTQRTAAWRIARRYLGHALNGNDPFRGTDGMTTQLRTLHAGRRLGRRIFSRAVFDCHLWSERGICLIKNERHAGKIGSCATGHSGWDSRSSSADAMIIRPGQPDEVITVRGGFESQAKARNWLLTPEGQDELRKAFLKLKP